jgi:hypothetical protein
MTLEEATDVKESPTRSTRRLPGVNGLGGMKDVDGVTLPEPEAVVDGVGPPDCEVVGDAAPEEDIVATCDREIVAETHADGLTDIVPLDDARGERVNERDAVTDPDKVRNAVGRVAVAETVREGMMENELFEDAETVPVTVVDLIGDAELFAEGVRVTTPELETDTLYDVVGERDTGAVADAFVVAERAPETDGEIEAVDEAHTEAEVVGVTPGDVDTFADTVIFADGVRVDNPELDAVALYDGAGELDTGAVADMFAVAEPAPEIDGEFEAVDEALSEAELVGVTPGDVDTFADSELFDEAVVVVDALRDADEVADASDDRDMAGDSDAIEESEIVLVPVLEADALGESVTNEDCEIPAERDAGGDRVADEAAEVDREARGLDVDDGRVVEVLLGFVERDTLRVWPADRDGDDVSEGGRDDDADVECDADLDASTDDESFGEEETSGELEAELLAAALDESEADADADTAVLAEGSADKVDVPDTVRVMPVACELAEADSVGASEEEDDMVADGVRGAARVPDPVRVGDFVGCDDKDALLVLFGGFVAPADFDDDTDMDDVLLSDALAETVADAVGRLEGAAEREAVGDDFTLRDGGADLVIDVENDAIVLIEAELDAETKAEAELPRGVPVGLGSND